MKGKKKIVYFCVGCSAIIGLVLFGIFAKLSWLIYFIAWVITVAIYLAEKAKCESQSIIIEKLIKQCDALSRSLGSANAYNSLLLKLTGGDEPKEGSDE